jgi:hypothetical protein
MAVYAIAGQLLGAFRVSEFRSGAAAASRSRRRASNSATHAGCHDGRDHEAEGEARDLGDPIVRAPEQAGRTEAAAQKHTDQRKRPVLRRAGRTQADPEQEGEGPDQPVDRRKTTHEGAPFTPRVFSGIQPSGGLTLGNYLGALKRFVDMQEAGSHETIYCMVDLHAITVWQDPKAAPKHARAVRGLHRLGIDPERSILFNQSQVPEHAQLAWIFNCVARMGWMGA